MQTVLELQVAHPSLQLEQTVSPSSAKVPSAHFSQILLLTRIHWALHSVQTVAFTSVQSAQPSGQLVQIFPLGGENLPVSQASQRPETSPNPASQVLHMVELSQVLQSEGQSVHEIAPTSENWVVRQSSQVPLRENCIAGHISQTPLEAIPKPSEQV